MVKNTILEFYPEMTLHISHSTGNDTKYRPVVYPSNESLRMYSFARFIKRRFASDNSILKLSDKNERKNILLIKKFTNLKKYRFGKKLQLRRLPALVLDRRLLCEISITPKKELLGLVEEFLVQIEDRDI